METSSSVFNNQFSISQFGEYYLPNVNRNTFEKVDSITAFKQKFKQDIFKQDTLHIILGMDSGLLVNYILEAPLSEGSKYIFVELPEIMAMLNIDIPESSKEYVKVMSYEELSNHIVSAEDDLFLIKDQVSLTLSLAASSGVFEQYTSLFSDTSRLINQHCISHKANFSQKSFFKQQMYNVAENKQPASLLKNKFVGKTAIIIGGGPSLDDHLDWIVENYHQLFILTVSRFAAKLSKAGIPAHIIVSVDPQDASFEVNRDMMSLTHESLFINSHHVNHRLISQWNGKSLFLGDQLPWLETNNIPTIGPTVTNSAIRIALEMGFNQILLTGVDFCHSPEGVTHATGSVEAKAGSNNSIIHEWVETYSGQIAETPIQLLYAAQGLEEEASLYPQSEIINLSKHAAKIKGVSHKETCKIVISSANCTPSQLLAMLPSISDDEVDYIDSLQAELTSAKNAFSAIEKLSKKALSINDSARKIRYESTQFQHKTQEIERIENKIIKKYQRYNMTIKVFGYFEFTQFLTTKNTKDWSDKQMNEMTHLYYRAYETISNKLQALTDISLDILALRKEEMKASPSIDVLVKGWQKNNQPGRIHLWLNRVGKVGYEQLSTTQKQQLKVVQDSYQEQLTSLSHPYFEMKKTNQDLTYTLAKVLDLKQNNNINGLTLLTKSIKPLIDKDNYASRLYYLAQHYIHFIEKDFEKALEALLQINKNEQTELELKQILLTALKVHRLELAKETLSILTQYSDEYAPQLAHILCLQGNHQQALNTYLDYLDKYPTDESILIKLGVFLADLGQIDGAKSSFEQVLIINPDNLAAKNYLAQVTN